MRPVKLLFVIFLFSLPTWATSWSLRSSSAAVNSKTTSPLTWTLGQGNPNTGDVVVFACANNATGGVTGVTIADSNSNNYTAVSSYTANSYTIYPFYLVEPSNATSSITITWTGSGHIYCRTGEFIPSGGTASLDAGCSALTGSGTTGTTINSPSPDCPAGDLMWADAVGGALSAPVSGATAGGWTGPDTAAGNSLEEYILSASGSGTAVDFTQTSGTWAAVAMGFKITASASGPKVSNTQFW
jgi:hypothetical protein